MALKRTYGKLYIDVDNKEWHINDAEPHICIKLKAVFAKISKSTTQPFKFIDTPENCNDLLWFTDRYPLAISSNDLIKLKRGKKKYIDNINELESILLPEHISSGIILRNGKGRNYQLQAKDLYIKCKRLLIGDDTGLGKTLIAILSFLEKGTLPTAVVCQSHLPKQWKDEIEYFTNLKVHIIKTRKAYSLPPADVYIFGYSKLSGWVDIFKTGMFRSVVFDEVQELRRRESDKYISAEVLSDNATHCLGLSATPIYNYGDEIFNIMNIIKEGCLGSEYDFIREWTRDGKVVSNPKALGAYLREQMLFLRRTRKDVGRELPPVNTIIHTVEYDDNEVKKAEEIARTLAIKVVSGSFVERGQASRDLDMFVRHYTGVAKAKGVAEYVKILLENNEPILLAGWHRDCFGKGTKVLMYNGTIKSVEDIAVGDVLMGADSKPRNVLSLISGNGKLFKVNPIKGDSWICSENHILALHAENHGYIKETANQFNNLSESQKRRRCLYRSSEIKFPNTKRVKESWLMGYWLGDGASRLNDLRIVSEDIEVFNECKKIAIKYGLKINSYSTHVENCKFYSFSSGKGKWGRNKLLNMFRSYGLDRNKHIPIEYKTASIRDRRELLAGLIDSDGYVYPMACGACFTNKNKTLADDVAYICRSIGLSAYVKQIKRKTHYSNKIETYYNVSISGDITSIPMRVNRKMAVKRRQIKSVLRTGLKIENYGSGDYFGFEVDGDNLFLLSDFTVVHNCYDIWLKELAQYNPVMYTGSESPTQKEKSKQAFINGETNLFIISLRSGIGLDGLQARCHTAVLGELDWSGQVHYQLISRVDRDKQEEPVTAIYLVSDCGSDPLMMDMLGLKASQSHGILNPFSNGVQEQYSDESRMKLLAQKYLNKIELAQTQ